MAINRRKFRPGDIIVHFKRYYPGEHRDEANTLQYIYRYDGPVRNTETGEMMATYTCLYDGEGCYMGEHVARPEDMFYSEVDATKYPNSMQKYRFEVMNDALDGRGLSELDFKAYHVARSVSHALKGLDDAFV